MSRRERLRLTREEIESGRPGIEIDIKAIREDLAAGMSIRATAKKHGISRRTLRRRLGL